MDFDPKKNYYDILGISETATAEEAKKAFKKLAVKHHPDRWWDKAKFQEINEAFQVLWDEKKKTQYDAYRKGWFWWFWGDGSGFDFWGFWWGQGWFDVDLWDIFWSVFWWWFGGQQAGPQSFSGEDIKVAIEISFEEAYLGVSKKVSYTRKIKMSDIDEKQCAVCHGKGRVSRAVQTPFGMMQSQTVCPECSGIGRQYTKNASPIKSPFENHKEIVEVKIPEGINDGVYIKFAGKWHQGLNGYDGDLYIKISITPSHLYERKWDNLYIKVPVTIFDLVLWWEKHISHPEGKLKVKIPKATQVGDMVKISGKWFGKSWIFWKKGDLFLIPKVEIPKKLTKEEEKLWKELAGA
jgi:molecular chaperone DnaJ